MATLDGFDVFGIDYTISIALNPRDEQRDAFFGLNGVERKPGGFRGRVARVSGRLQGIGPAGLAAAEAALGAFYDGQPHILVDTIGRVWPRMKLVRFEPQDPIFLDTDGYWSRTYRAELEAPT